MIGFICLFFPPVISVIITKKIRKEKYNYEQYIAQYAVFVLIINGIIWWILSFLFDKFDKHSISSPDVFTTSFSARYILLSSFLAIVIAYVPEIVRKIWILSTYKLDEEDVENKSDEEE
jgi:Kef-type K+ transport system membrane component KefB